MEKLLTSKAYWTVMKLCSIMWLPISPLLMFVIFRMVWLKGESYSNKTALAWTLVWNIYYHFYTSPNEEAYEERFCKKIEKILEV